MPSSSRGAAVTILVRKLTHNRQPGQVRENEEHEENPSDDCREVHKEQVGWVQLSVKRICVADKRASCQMYAYSIWKTSSLGMFSLRIIARLILPTGPCLLRHSDFRTPNKVEECRK